MSKPTSNALLLTNNKEYNLSSERIPQSSRKDAALNAESGFIVNSHRRAGSNIDNYPEMSGGIGSTKKIVYQNKVFIEGNKKQISLKNFNDMKFNATEMSGSTMKNLTLHNSPRFPILKNDLSSNDAATKELISQTMLMDFDQEWKINDNLKRMK